MLLSLLLLSMFFSILLLPCKYGAATITGGSVDFLLLFVGADVVVVLLLLLLLFLKLLLLLFVLLLILRLPVKYLMFWRHVVVHFHALQIVMINNNHATVN